MDFNSAQAYAAFEAVQRQEIEKKKRHDALLAKGAEASIENAELLRQQNDLLSEQLAEVKERNTLLQEMYDASKKEAEDNKKDALHNKVFGWVSFGVGTLIGIAGIVFGIIFNG